MNDYKKDFPILNEESNGKKIAYLDSGATTQKPQYVLDAVVNYYNNSNANPHRGSYDLSLESTEMYDRARAKVKGFINANRDEEIVFTRNSTESLNLIAYSYGRENIKKDDVILITIMEHHSNLVPWQMIAKEKGAKLEYIYLDEDGNLNKEDIEKKLVKGVKIFACTHVSNVLGTTNDVEYLTKKAHDIGATVIIDASQSVPHMKVDVKKIDCDFLVFSGHKMLAPYGIGVLYGKYDVLDKMKPFLYGGDMIEYVEEQNTTFAPVPTKFEAGTQNIGAAIGLEAAIDYLEKIGMDNVEKHEKELIDYCYSELEKLDYVTIYGPKENRSGLISFNIRNLHSHDVATVLNKYGVCIRTGNHCAQPLHKYLGLESTCRASFYIYNDFEDVDRLIMAIKKTKELFDKWI